MAAEYVYNEIQTVSLNSPVNFNNSMPCKKGYVVHNNSDGIFILRGITNQCFTIYRVIFNGNIAVPTGGTVPDGGIAVAITVNGEPRLTSKAIFVPAAAGDNYGNVTSTAIIRVPKGCCFSLSVDAVPALLDPTVTPAPQIAVQNSNLVITRIA